MDNRSQAIATSMERAFEANEPDVTRRNILLHALEVFAENGVHDARIQDIAEHAGFSQGYVYRYYRSKEHMLVRLLELAGQGAADTVQYAAGLPGTAWQRILALAEAMVCPSAIAMQHWKLLMVSAGSPQALREYAQEVTRSRAKPVLQLIPLLEEAQKEGSVVTADPMMLSATFFSVLQGVGQARSQFGASLPLAQTAWILKFLQPNS